jgi:hypothetical protein
MKTRSAVVLFALMLYRRESIRNRASSLLSRA